MSYRLLCLYLLLLPAILIADEARLDAPKTATVGETIDVHWQGVGDKYDTIFIAPAGTAADAKAIHTATITNKKNPIALRMPEEPGDYELRYRARADGTLKATRAISVEEVESSLQAEESAPIGSNLSVSWVGPGNQYDRIELHEKGTQNKALHTQSVLNKKNPIIMHMPEYPGSYELRYVLRETGRVLARKEVLVTDVPSSLDAPEEASPGETIAVHWKGPGNQYDRIEVHVKGAQDDAKAEVSQGILSKRNPIQIKLPEVAGEYELRYETTRSKRVLSRRPIVISSSESMLEAVARATAGTTILVSWTGPGNNYDQIGVYTPGSPDDAKPLRAQSILNKKNPLPLLLPEKEGDYEIRYRTMQRKMVLARKPITIEPAGTLSVVFERTTTKSKEKGDGAIELILDASGSMLQRAGEKRRIEIARDVLVDLVSNHLDDTRPFALRVFGHKEKDSCRTDLEIAPGDGTREEAATKIALIEAMNLAKTPIADSLAKVPFDLKGIKGPKSVVLVTDGEETCDGNPEAVIASLKEKGLDIQLSIVGFAIEDEALKKDFQTWATLGGGSYFDAASADELISSLRTVISGPYQVLNEKGELVARGVIGGADIILPAGSYRVETIAKKPLVLDTVEIRAGEKTEVAF